MSAPPRRRFWLLCAVVLPLANVPVIAVFLFASGDASSVTVALAVAAELALLGWLAVVSSQCPADGYECPF
jgi:hypothetical protein